LKSSCIGNNITVSSTIFSIYAELLNQGFWLFKLKSSLQKFYGCHHDLVATVTENLCHKWPRICFTCRKHFPVISLFMTYHWVCNSSNRTGATSGAGTAYPSWAPEFTPWFFGTAYPSWAPEFTRWFFVGFVSLDLYFYVWYFVDRCLFFCPFSFGHCVVWPSLIYGFLLPL
jgi:hypothetical protein